MRTSFFILFFLALTGHAQNIIINRFFNQTSGGGGGATYLINQNFEGAGFDNSESWSEVADPNEDDTAAPSPLVGAQSLRFSAVNQRVTSPAFTGQLECWIYFQWHIVTLPAAGADICTLLGAGVGVDINSAGTLRIGGSANSLRTSDALSTGTTYHIRVHYVADQDGGAASAVFSVEFSTTSTFTGSGNKFTSITTGTETATATQLRIQGETGDINWVVDKVLVDDAVINAP